MQKKVPSAISNITLNRATFKNEEIKGLSFVNFFYGNNGVGKSSIAHAIEDGNGVVWSDGKNASSYDVLVYNMDFINRNFVNYRQLQGVYIFGEENSEAKKRIEQLTEERKQKSDAHTVVLAEYQQKKDELSAASIDFQDACFAKTSDLRKRFDKALVGKKQKKRFSEAILGEIHPIDQDLTELKQLCDTAFDDTARVYPEFKRIGTTTTYGSLPGKELLDKIIVSSGDTPFSQFVKALGAAASDWVRSGHTHYVGVSNGKCPFCQQKLPVGFEAEIAACFDEKYRKDIRNLMQFQSSYERETSEIVRILSANLNDAMPNVDTLLYRDKLSILENNFEINRQRISDKVKEPSITVSLEDTDTLLLELGAIIDDINKTIKANNDVVAQKRDSKKKCKDEIIRYFAFMLADDIKSYRYETARLNSEIESIAKKDLQIKQDIASLNSQIAVLNKHNVNTEHAIESINKILNDSGFQGFGIRAKKGIENVYEIIREDGTIAENLSEGERNFIAFLYFYHQVRGSMNDRELKEKIVVIDDPVSGMDSAALFLVSAIVREMINVCMNNTEYLNPKTPGDYIKQLFILTHNVYFHREVTYRQVGHYKCTSFYMIRKNDNISTVKLCTRPNQDEAGEEENYNPVQNSYAALWDELRDIKSTIPALNVMRRILKYYFLQLCGYKESDLQEIVLENEDNRKMFIKEIDGEKPDMTDYRLASSLLAYINNINGIDEEPIYIEDCDDVSAYKRVFRKIFEALNQNQHYRMMTGQGKSIG